jgi:succinyl-CoA synthetase alpha subunit
MPILIDHTSRVLIHGVEGTLGFVHQLMSYGTDVVAYVQAGRGGETILNLPVYDCVSMGKKQSGATVSLVFSPPLEAADAILEAENAGISLIVCHTTNIPQQDMVEVQRIVLRNGRSRLIGPGSYGVITPGQSKVGCMPGYNYMPGNIGIVSRFGTLMDEVAGSLTSHMKGQSTCVSIGEYPFVGTTINDVISLFEKDERTETIIVIGRQEDCAAVKKGKKRVAGLAVDMTQPAKSGFPVYDSVSALISKERNI